MKRVIASLMLVLFLVNVLGYYGILQGFKSKSTVEWASQAGDEVEGLGETVTFRIPLTVPYATDSREYESITGQFEFGGEVYQLVKQKLLKDTLYVVGVKDEASSMWGRALADYVMTFGDTNDDAPQQAPTVSTGFAKDFVSLTISVDNDTAGWVRSVSPSSPIVALTDTFDASFVHPPERA